MTTTIEMAREVFDVETDDRGRQTFSIDTYGVERFAALVRADERNRTWSPSEWGEYERSIAAAEREACARIVEVEAMQYAEPVWAFEIVNDIRARGDKHD
jgi:hypothetical protein